MKPLPPLKALVAFDAAMRRSSFSLAAEDLSVTAGAIGQQIRLLEEFLAFPLFVRETRRVTPTPAARDYWKEVEPALAQLRQATWDARQSRTSEVRVSMPPGFAAKWFAQRMAGFVAAHPEIALYLSSSSAMIDFEQDGFDLAIRHFNGHDPELDSTLLWQDELRAYCAPGYARQVGLASPADMIHATLLHHSLQPYWRNWLQRHAGLQDGQIAALPGIHFDQTLPMLESARREQGVMLASAALMQDEVESGALVDLFGLPLEPGRGFYVVHHRRKPLRPAALALKDWFIQSTPQAVRHQSPPGARPGRGAVASRQSGKPQ